MDQTQLLVHKHTSNSVNCYSPNKGFNKVKSHDGILPYDTIMNMLKRFVLIPIINII